MAKAKSKKKNTSILTKIVIVLIIFIILPIICIVGFWMYVDFQLSKKSLINTPTTFEITRGETIQKVGAKLEATQQIPSAWFFKVFLKTKNYSSLPAGEFLLPAHADTRQIVQIFREAKTVAHKFTVIDGTTAGIVLKALKNAPYLSGDTPDSWDEGYLLADTFSIPKGTSRLALLKRMRRALERILDKEWQNRGKNIAVKTKAQALILASIIEKETAIKSERFKVSAVYSNRLRLNMKLQADPTTIYGITKGRYKLTRSLTHKDLSAQNDYNTYVKFGLPKTAIAIVSRESINAALHPANVDYLYFVATGYGGSKFARTYKEHERNIKSWLKVLKSRKK